ncbi:MAG TPA: hypothetical protein DEA05_12795, partial [Rhodobacteraceae bacterium]|nr:hypothetical protein [Paracoccaceae bacterium]
MNRTTLLVRYAGFAVLATLANLGAQRLVLWVDAGLFLVAMATGTGVGLVCKYLLDKRWIFYDARHPAREEGRRFTLYTLTGIGTTLIFWGFETAFWLTWQTDAMRELGAVIRLAQASTKKMANPNRNRIGGSTTPAATAPVSTRSRNR